MTRYWDVLNTAMLDKIQYPNMDRESSDHASLLSNIQGMFKGQTMEALVQTKHDIEQ